MPLKYLLNTLCLLFTKYWKRRENRADLSCKEALQNMYEYSITTINTEEYASCQVNTNFTISHLPEELGKAPHIADAFS